MEQIINNANDRLNLNRDQIKTIIRAGDVAAIFKPSVPQIVVNMINADCRYHCGHVKIPELNISGCYNCYIPVCRGVIIGKSSTRDCALTREHFWGNLKQWFN